MYLSYKLHALKEEQMKTTKYLFFLLFLLFGVLAFAADWNCKINLPPNPQNYPKELLLRMMYVDITNSEHQAVTVYLHGEVRRDGKLIGKGNSNKIEIPPGGKRITRSDITKIKKEWWDKEFEKLLFRLPTLPAGDYEACIFVYKAKGKKLLTKCCTGFESKPISPPRLISPKDGATLKEKYPLFRWTPPTPTFPGVTYTLRIVEVPKGMPESISEEELQLCPTTHEEKGITRTSFKYPSSAKELEKGKRYAWQVTAFLGEQKIGRSEVGTFSFAVSPKEGRITTIEQFGEVSKQFKDILPSDQHVDFERAIISAVGKDKQFVFINAPVTVPESISEEELQVKLAKLYSGELFIQALSISGNRDFYLKKPNGEKAKIEPGIYLFRIKKVKGTMLGELVSPRGDVHPIHINITQKAGKKEEKGEKKERKWDLKVNKYDDCSGSATASVKVFGADIEITVKWGAK